MSRLLAIEWDAREARLVVGRMTGRSLSIESVVAVPLESSEEESLRTQLAQAVTQRGLGRNEWLVAVPRSRAELRVLQVPPVPDEELPDLVRFQAVRQFSSLAEEAPLDFVRLDGGQGTQIRVLAASLSTKVLEDFKGQCAAFDGKAQRLVLRPFASASLIRRSRPDSECRLLVEMMAEEADLTVLVRGQAVLVRSVRIPSHDPAGPLIGEIRRTIVAAQNQIGEEVVQVVTLVGDPQHLQPLQEQLAEKLEVPIDLFDPFASLNAPSDATLVSPEHRGRYAALLGMLCDEAEGKPHGIDFLNPRRRPQPVNRRRRYAVLGGIAALCALVLIWMIAGQLNRLDTRIRELQTVSRDLDEQVKIAQKIQSDVEEIDRFVRADINWLDELYRMSDKFPPPADAIVEQATFTATLTGGGSIQLEGFVRQPEVIQTMEEDLRSSQHQVTGSGAQRVQRREDLPWEFKERIVIQPADLDDLSTAAIPDPSDPSDPSDLSDLSDPAPPETTEEDHPEVANDE